MTGRRRRPLVRRLGRGLVLLVVALVGLALAAVVGAAWLVLGGAGVTLYELFVGFPR